jgi:hypothetical protein
LPVHAQQRFAVEGCDTTMLHQSENAGAPIIQKIGLLVFLGQ